jgi:hypothetical protein
LAESGNRWSIELGKRAIDSSRQSGHPIDEVDKTSFAKMPSTYDCVEKSSASLRQQATADLI